MFDKFKWWTSRDNADTENPSHEQPDDILAELEDV